MITVKVEVKDSPKHGRGLFLLQPVLKNTALYYFNPKMDTSFEVSFANKWHLHFGYVCRLKPSLVTLCGDESRWWNFADTPEEVNAAESEVILNGEPVIVATRDMVAGEELLIDPQSDLLAHYKLGR